MPPGCGEGFPEAEDGGILQGAPVGCPPSCQGIQLLVSLTEDPSHPLLGQLADRRSSSQPQVTCLSCTSMSLLPVGAGLEAGESKVTLNPEVLLGGCTACWYGLLVNSGGVEMAGRWLVPSEEPVAPDLSYPEQSLAACPSQQEVYDGVVTGCWGKGTFHRNVSQMEIPGGGSTSLDIPPQEVLGVVTPPEEAVIPYP